MVSHHESRKYADVKIIKTLPVGKISESDASQLKDYNFTYGCPVRQKTNWQQTTMASAGTLSDFCYSKKLHGTKIYLTQTVVAGIEGQKGDDEEEGMNAKNDGEIADSTMDDDGIDDVGDEIIEYEPNSSGTDEEDIIEPIVDGSNLFLVGRVSKFGRKVQLNKKLFL